MSDPNATTSNAVSNVKQRHWAAWVLDIFVAIGVVTQIWVGILLLYELKEFEASNKITRESLELSRKNFELTAKSVDLTAQSVALTQKGTELSQKSIELTQKSLEAGQEALKYANKANEISEKGVEAANTPWIDVSISNVTDNGSDGLFIDYTLQNHSDSPATSVISECYLQHAGVSSIDEGAFSSTNLGIMPHQPVTVRARMMTVSGDPRVLLKQVNDAKVNIKIHVIVFGSTGKKTAFVKTFHKKGNTFAIIDMQFNPPWADIEKMIHESANPQNKK